MKILLITNSARGEAIAEALVRSERKPEVIALSTVASPGLLRMCSGVYVQDILDFSAILGIAKSVQPAFAFIAPDDPIGLGLADELEKIGIPSIAPKKSLARIESSKGFARELLQKYEIDASPIFRSFQVTSDTNDSSGNFVVDDALKLELRGFLSDTLQGNYVVKYDALKGGKGVKVSGEHLTTIDEGVAYAVECLEECGRVVVEEKLIGVEFSLLSFVSGTQVVDMPVVQDHKRAYEGDTGPNTGGMGSYSDANHSLPFLTHDDLTSASELNRRVAKALFEECGESYMGILYGGFIATKNGVKVIEYNARFGDPEALNILPLLETDFVDVCQAILTLKLDQLDVRFRPFATVCKYMTPLSYPDAKNEQGVIVNVPAPLSNSVRLYYGDVMHLSETKVMLGGSRSIGVVGIAPTIAEAEVAAQSYCEKLQGPVRFRNDIGKAELIEKKVAVMKGLRG